MQIHLPMMDRFTVTYKPPARCRASFDRPSHFLAYRAPYATGLCSLKAKATAKWMCTRATTTSEGSLIVELSCGTAHIVDPLAGMNRSHVPRPQS